ncbi:PREDICTED: uncharacterized protein LOC104605059 isoform X3 [Nelumbo nucifera]|uniref:Uncharacterized protein LOC104605059 isoform X3 n=1 Tax=Nelumbo nucifera TaxID=4432 RepID=A0A1U8AP47_NELNU|nr:PREDICTED: uncharacterized protein LOC104605059 isoform X3 [Nelumbo nucifera]
MRPLALPRLLTFSFPSQCSLRSKSRLKSPGFSVLSSPIQSQATEATNTDLKSEYKPGIFDNLFLALFRNKMVQVSWIFNAHIATKMVLIVLLFLMPTVLYSSCLLSNYCMSHVGPFNVIKMLYLPRATQEVGWDSEKPGYDGLIEVANRLMMNGRSNAETAEAAVRILRSLFPPFLLELFKMLIAPIDGGKVASMMVARVTALSCQWLMGSCTVNSVDLPDGSSCTTGVFVERCKYLEESKCIGICINTCFLQGLHGCPFINGAKLQ